MNLQQRIPLTLQPYTNSLENIELYEPIPVDKLGPLNPIDENDGNGGERKMLQNYHDNYRTNGQYVAVKYTRNKNISYGRFLPHKAMGIHNLRTELKHELIGYWGQNINIKNYVKI